MFYKKLLNLINRTWIGSIIAKREKILKNTDPDRIYVENIRSFFNLPSSVAKVLCELAVKENYFVKRIGVECGNEDCGRIIKTYSCIQDIDKEIHCDQCEYLEREEFIFNSENLTKTTYYQLVRQQ